MVILYDTIRVLVGGYDADADGDGDGYIDTFPIYLQVTRETAGKGRHPLCVGTLL